MIPKIVTPNDLRKNLADFLKLATKRLIVVKDKDSNKVILDEREFNRLFGSIVLLGGLLWLIILDSLKRHKLLPNPVKK